MVVKLLYRKILYYIIEFSETQLISRKSRVKAAAVEAAKLSISVNLGKRIVGGFLVLEVMRYCSACSRYSLIAPAKN